MQELWEHQRQGIVRALSEGNFGFLWEPGTGKTRVTIEVLRHRFSQEKRVMRTLIVAPQVVCTNWKHEFLKYSKIDKDQIQVLSGSGRERFEQFVSGDRDKIVICNYHSLLMPTLFEEFKTWAPEIIIADESHRIKNPKAQMTKRLILLAQFAKFRYILTGTPILQNTMDLFSQFEFLDLGKTFGRNFFSFRRRYFTDANAGLRARSPHVTWAKWVPLKRLESELTAKISAKTMAVKKEECLDLPPYVQSRIEVPLSQEQAKAYNEMRQHMITFMKGEACTAQMALHKALRLQQITSGFVGDDEGNIHEFKDVPRLDALRELLEDLCETEKVIVWACWKQNHKAIREMLIKAKIGFRELTGDTSSGDRDQAIQDFRNDESVRCILGSQGAGGIGINLIEASHAIYYSRNFSLEHDIQSQARNYRGGSGVHSKITRLDLVAPGTIDEDVLEALEKKQEVSDRVIFQCLKS